MSALAINIPRVLGLRSPVVLVWLVVWLGACRTDAVDPGYGAAGEPRILTVTIPGIPADSIVINDARRA